MTHKVSQTWLTKKLSTMKPNEIITDLMEMGLIKKDDINWDLPGDRRRRKPQTEQTTMSLSPTA